MAMLRMSRLAVGLSQEGLALHAAIGCTFFSPFELAKTQPSIRIIFSSVYSVVDNL